MSNCQTHTHAHTHRHTHMRHRSPSCLWLVFCIYSVASMSLWGLGLNNANRVLAVSNGAVDTLASWSALLLLISTWLHN